MTLPAHLRGFSLPQKQNTQGQNGGLVWPPLQDSPGSWQGGREPRIRAPPAQIQTGSWVISGALTKAFIPKKLISRECVSFPIHRGALSQYSAAKLSPGSTDKFPQHGLFCFAAASLSTDAAVGRSGRVSTHTQCSVTTQTSTKRVSNRLMKLPPWVEKQRCNISGEDFEFILFVC